MRACLHSVLRSPAPALLWDREERIYLNRVLQPQHQHLVQSELRSCYSLLFTFFLNLNKTRGGKCSNEIAPAYVSNSWGIKIKFYLSSTTHLQWIMNTEVLPVCIEHVHTAHSCLILLLEVFIFSYYYKFKHRRQFQHLNYLERRLIMLLWKQLFFYQLTWQIQAKTLSSSLVSHLDYCDSPLNLLWFIFPWYQTFKAQAAKDKKEQPLVYQQHFSFWSLLPSFLVYHNFSKGSASLKLLLFVPRTTLMLRKSWVQWNEVQNTILLLRAEIISRVSEAKKVGKKLLLRFQSFFVEKLKVASLHV